MAARKTRGTLDKPWDDRVRAKIQTSMLVNRLTGFVKGEVKLESAQVTAALGLLRKTIPDLSATTLSGDKDNPILTITRIEIVAEDDHGPNQAAS